MTHALDTALQAVEGMATQPTTQGHTPGPWMVLDDGQTIDGGLTITAGGLDGFRVAHVNPDVGDEHICCEANARLIAAAPELLRVAKLCRDEWPERFTPCFRELSNVITLATVQLRGK